MSVPMIPRQTNPNTSTVRAIHAGPSRVWQPLRVHECFELLADRQPAAPAIISDSGILSYAELDRKSNALAHALLAIGISTEEAVGVLAGRSGHLPLAYLAILKAGGAYVPMGADLPAQRLANMATQSGMRCLVVLDGLEPPPELAAALASNPAGGEPVVFRPEQLSADSIALEDRRPSVQGHPTDLAAILFTSGSTGHPKGVLLRHDSCLNMGYGHIDAHGITPDDRLLLAAAPGFIMGFRELCLPLMAGCAYVPVSRTLLDDPSGLLAFMSRHRVSVAMFTPSYLHLLRGVVPDGLRCLLTAGERPNAEDARVYARKLDYWNIQGATEVCGTFCMTLVDPNGEGPLPSGRPFPNTTVCLLNAEGNEVEPGEPGEIHVVGVGVARGYLNQPDLTADRFVETQFGRAYRSGDMGRWNADSQLESLGRVNDVVKVSGQAVSLGEVEHTLLRHETVRYAATMQHEGRLIAFVETDGTQTSLEDWHRFLGQTLPTYMLPARVTTLPKMPVNSYGKVDRQALLALAIQTSQSSNGTSGGAPPQGEVERQIAEVWAETLHVRPIARDDNFFALGGTSLLSIVISQRLHARGYAVSAQTILSSTTIAALAGKIALAREEPLVPQFSDTREGAATAGQEDFWIAWKLGLSTTGAQITRVLAVLGVSPDPARWQSAWTRMVARHPALRTAFCTDANNRVCWHTAEAEKLTANVSLRFDRCHSLNDARECITAHSNATFALSEPPLARAGLVRVTEGSETLFWFTLHHSVVDGLSARIIQDEMHDLLLDRPLAPAPDGVAQASHAEQQYLASSIADRDRAYWRDKLDSLTADAFNEFRTDHRRPESPSGKPAIPLTERLDATTVAALSRLARSQRVGLHALLVTLLAVEARRRDGRSSLIIGSGISIRPPGADMAVGHFVNLLPLIHAGGNLPTLAAQIRATQTTLTEAVEHGAYPASLLYREFRQRHPHARPHARTSLFDISLTTAPSRASGDSRGGFSLTPKQLPGELAHPAAGLDLDFSHEPSEDNGGLELTLVWNADVYTRSTAEAWLRSFAGWARWLAEDISRADAPLPALLPEEAQCLDGWEHGPARPRPAKRFHELFEEVADRNPYRAAVIAAGRSQNYAELEHRANCVAQELLRQGVAPQEPVAVLTECSADLPSVVLGIWKAGATYVPLAVEHPPVRLAHIARDSGARTLIVVDGHNVPAALAECIQTTLRLETIDWKAPAERPAIAGSPHDLAFVIYTSGTTGMPKGVLLRHDSLINAAYASGEIFGLTPDDRFALVATPGFDASLWELGASLLHGMAVVPVSQAVRDDPWALKQWYTAHGVTVAFHAPSYLRVGKKTPFQGLRVLICGGEAPNHDDVRWHTTPVEFFNAYGPTETCIFVCANYIPPNPDPDRPLPTGPPLPNTRISIRRDNGERVPPGVLGEVWIGGTGVARGYLNNPELTAQRFVDAADGRFYRSGDLGRWTEDGRLELAGRVDHQIKFHGQRMELGEIEQALASHPAVEEAVVLVEASANDTKSLWGFVRLRADAAMPEPDEWRAYFEVRLPLYMIPAAITAVAAMPLTFAGKIDRDALLLAPRQRHSGTVKSAPSGAIETLIAGMWSELLGDDISREDNFFALGGNSLLAVTLAHRLSHEFGHPVPARELFAAPTLAGFARRVSELQVALNGDQAAAPTQSDLATAGQREFWVAEATGLDTRTFTIPLLRIVEGETPSLDEWDTAWAKLVARHESLRTSFHEDAQGRLRRTIAPSVTATLETSIRPDMPSARAFVRQRQDQPFKMGVPPLWRAGLVEVEDSDQNLFWLALHHSVGDGQSIGILVEELGALLRGEELPPLTCEFAESAGREAAYLASPACAEDGRYWADLLARQPDSAFAEAPLDYPRSATAKTGNHRFETRLDAATTQGLKNLARWHEASLHAVILTLLALETRRRTGRSDIIIGTAASVRESAAEAAVVGYYVNMLPVPCRLTPELTFGTALREIQKTLATGLQHERYPFARMYHDFWGQRPQHRHPARYPLFDLAVTENPVVPPAPASLRLNRMAASEAANQEDISYELTDASPGSDMVVIHEGLADGGMLLLWHVNAAFYSQETARNWFESLSGWARWLAVDRKRARGVLPVLLPLESALLESWELGATVARPPLRFHELFELVLDGDAHQAARPAIVTETNVTTYGALEQQANAIAHSLLAGGVTPGSVIGVLTERSANLAAAVLAIWKAGATYLPLAADLPPERLAFMAHDAGITRFIALDGLAVPPSLARDLPSPLRPEELDAEFRRNHLHRPPPSGSAANVAYIIYTSGSTGRPKGTLIGHAAYVNSILGTGETLGYTRDDRSLMFSSPSFDVSLSDIGLPLSLGASVCPVPYDVLVSPNRFQSFLTRLNVTVADITPTYLRLFDGAELSSLRILVTGGEAPFAADVRTYARRHRYFNAYGPTENTISSTLGELSPDNNGILSGGRPLPNTSIHICDSEGNPVAPGVVGELWLGGAGLARGYVGLPELTAAAFIETARGRRYRTGDLGRWRATGEIEILGRIDDQVKLNGIRIELGEIEHALDSHPAIAQTVVVVDGDAKRTQSLWAFVRLRPGQEIPEEENWRGYLANRLPAYMIPSALIAIPKIPLSNAGKVDKAALRAMLAGRTPQGKETPHEGLEAAIALTWSELLGRGPIHRDDNFFALGGHSLLAIAVSHRLEATLGYPCPARELFAQPVLRDFAHRISQLDQSAVDDVRSDRATEGQREFWVAEQAGLDTRGFIIPLTVTAHGAVATDAQWTRAWAALVERHDALRTAFYQDPDGVLRRSILSGLVANLEISTEPDLATDLATARALILERQTVPFSMENPPLWRAGLVHVAGTDQPLFWLALHHSIGDGVSLGVLIEDLSTVLRGGSLSTMVDDFDHSAGREESYLASPACEEDALSWRNRLNGLGNGSPDTPQPFDEWPLDFPRLVVRTARNNKGAHCFRVRLDSDIATGLRDFAQKNGASLHAVMLTIMAQEVRRRTGRPEFLLGTAASTRDLASEARTIGYYVNMLPVPCQVDRREPIQQALRTMQRSLAEGLQHSRYPFSHMYRDFRENQAQTPHPARYPLFDISVTENPGPQKSGQLNSIADNDFRYTPRLNAPAQDMVLVHEGQPDGSLTLVWFVNAALYEKDTAEAWIESIAGWARFIADRTQPMDSPLPALLPDEEALLSGWERGPNLPHPSPTVPARFEHWARVQPERPAVITEEGAQSFAAVSARANALAHALLSLGVKRQEVVGVFTDRSLALPETVLSIWKAGACYLPLVRDLPADRLAFVARDAGIRVLVILDGHEPPPSLLQAGCKIFRPESLTEAFLREHSQSPEISGGDATGSDLACILYTSGSTGMPKGVMLQHQGLVNLGTGMGAIEGIRSDDRMSLIASPSFDAWINDLVIAWTAGAAVIPILHDEIVNVAGMRDKVARLGITVATMTPSYLRLFEQADFPGLRVLMTVGEPPHPDDARYYAARLFYFNGYGPTENTAAASGGQVASDARRLTAGKPLANTSIHILDRNGEPVPPGAVGFVWLGGMGLAPGYWKRPDLTAAAFVDTPAGRRYATGDLGRWTSTGDLEIMGRSDGQVKLRGQRVELGEIDHRLSSHPDVLQGAAAVETLAGGSQTLWAFVCLHPGPAEPTQGEWRDYLSRALPSYMLPTAVLQVPAIPMNISGKVDRGALLSVLSEIRSGAGEPAIHKDAEPRDDVERRIAQVWAEHLGCRSIAREDNFFDLGGNSLRAIAAVNQLRRTFHCEINDLYEHPRLADFANVCRPRPEHLKALLQSAARHWRGYQDDLAEYELERETTLTAALREYDTQNQPYQQRGAGKRRNYGHVLLTGATGYLGSYLLRELLADGTREVTALVRGNDDRTARARLGEILHHYFGRENGASLRDHPRLHVLAGDLRRDDLSLSAKAYDRLANSVQAVFHSAANVKHFGHYGEFHADNVAATGRLLKLAAHRKSNPADFHLVSTLSACGRAPENGFRLFTEYNAVPDTPDENYYIRSKQEAERLVIASRADLANACIHRVGNLVFAADGGPLQFNIRENAFFRQIAAFIRLGAVPNDSHVWLCHVDLVARGLVLLAEAADLANETHHLENGRRDTLASFVTAADGVQECGFDVFLEGLEAAVDDPSLDAALTETLETFGLYRGVSPQSRARRLEIVSGRTQTLLARMGLVWPPIPDAGRAEMLRQASRLFTGTSSSDVGSIANDVEGRGVAASVGGSG